MFSKKMSLSSPSGALVEAFSIFSSLALQIIMIIISIQALIYFKDNLIVRPADALIDNLQEKTPIE